MKLLMGEARKTMLSATSSGVAMRFMGVCATCTWMGLSGWAASLLVVSGVATKPGQMALMRILSLAYELASALVRPTTPCLAAV